MHFRLWMAAVFIIACGSGRAAAGDVEAVTPRTSGVLTKCRAWVVATCCQTYQHVNCPARIAGGDTIALRFGSSPKDYAFPVARIDLKGSAARFSVKPRVIGTEWTRSMSRGAIGRGKRVDTTDAVPLS